MEVTQLHKPYDNKHVTITYVNGNKSDLEGIVNSSFTISKPGTLSKEGAIRKWVMDCRKGLSSTENLQSAADWFVNILDTENIDQIALKGYGAYFLAGAILTTSYKPITAAIIREKGPKGYDLDKLIEGTLDPTKKVLVVDDIINSGTSTLSAINCIIEAGQDRSSISCAFLMNFMWGKGVLSLNKRGFKNIYHAMEVTE